MFRTIEPLSTNDDPRGVAIVLYTDTCNLRCPYCHNKTLITGEEEGVPFDGMMYLLRQRRKLIDNVVICGGEPTACDIKYLKDQILEIRALGYHIKFDTNGIIYGNLRSVVMDGLVDYVAMDIKTGFDNYMSLTSKNLIKMSSENIRENLMNSILFLIRSVQQKRLESFEFRTTCVDPYVTIAEMMNVISDIRTILPSGVKIPVWYLQRARLNDKVMNPKIPMRALNDDEITEVKLLLESSGIAESVQLR